MQKYLSYALLLFSLILLTGCASVRMAAKEEDTALKNFSAPPPQKAGLYVFRNSFVGQALTKNLYVDNQFIGETANGVYYYLIINPGEHTISTESEFSDNSISFTAEAGKNYFAEQYMKMGVFVGGANLQMVDEETGKKEVLDCELAAGRGSE